MLILSAVKEGMADIEATGVNTQPGDQFAIWFATTILNEDLDDVKDRYHIGNPDDNHLDIGILDGEHDAILILQSEYSNDPLHTTFGKDLANSPVIAERLRTMPDAGNAQWRAFAAEYNAQGWNAPERLIAVGFGKFSDAAKNYAHRHNVELYDYGDQARFELAQQFATRKMPESLTLTVGPTEIDRNGPVPPKRKSG